MKKTCLITGVNGFVGSHVAKHFHAQGWHVEALTSTIKRTSPYQQHQHALGQAIDSNYFHNMDAFIHCAHDFTAHRWKDIFNINVEGSVSLLHAAKQAGVKHILFISSISAYEGCQSYYGRSKLLIEEKVKSLDVKIIRPGLIFGSNPKSLLGSLTKLAGLTPVIPLIGNGKQPFHMCHVNDLCQLLFKLCSQECKHISNAPIIAGTEDSVSFRNILKVLGNAQRGKEPIFIPFPSRLIWLGLKLVESLGLKPPFRSDSVKTLFSTPQLNFQPTKELGIMFRPFKEETL